MTYASEQDLIDRFGENQIIELSDRGDPPSGTIDSAIVADALADADAEINSYVGKRYDLPIASVPARLVSAAAIIAFHKLHRYGAPDNVVADFAAERKFLKDVAAGLAVLDLPAGSEPETAGARVEMDGPERIFDRKSLKGF